MQWRSEGLAPGDLAVDNALAIILQVRDNLNPAVIDGNGLKWVFSQGTMNPHILDSTGKSIQWIAFHFKSSTVEIASQGDKRFANVLGLATRFVTFYERSTFT